ncbi:MAG: hypothetical protein HYZ27_06105 [Deltaproteobacteria bacterium]|nr:hypothetical protein [Deltaproteobacteria bacterium]
MGRKTLVRAQVTGLAAAALTLLACGPDGRGEVRVSVLGTRGGSYLDPSGVDLGSNIFVSQALVRLGRVTVSSDTQELARETPLYVNLFEEVLVLQGDMASSAIREVAVEVPAPQGDGVLPGEPVSIFVTGSIEGIWFEYRDVDTPPISVETEEELNEGTTLEMQLQFDLKDWFDGIEAAGLTEGTKPSGDPCFFIDASRNSGAQMQIEQSMRDSLSLEAEEIDVED